MDAKVTWQTGMALTGTATSGFEVPIDADRDVGGAEQGFIPLELMAVSLAGCTALDVLSILKKKQQVLSAFEVKVHTDQAPEHPHVFTHAVITYLVTGQAVQEAAVLRAIELSAVKYCPAQAMLGQVMPIDMNYEIYEGASANQRSLVKTGRFIPTNATT